MNKKKKVNNKTKKSSTKKSKSSSKKNDKIISREKVYGDPTPVKPLTYVDGEIYPRLVFKESLWTRFKRFLGLVP